MITPETVVWRAGEIFGEYGVAIPNPDVELNTASAGPKQLPPPYTKWQLVVLSEARDEVFNEELPAASTSKVVKLKAATPYVVKTRIFSMESNEWSDWSAEARTRTFSAVTTLIPEIGEDYVRILWDRAQRDMSQFTPERDVESVQRIASISRFEVRLVREMDMRQEYVEEFPSGVRSHTVYDLRPGTAYIVFVRYETLIGTLKQWAEVGRFYTQPAHEVTLTARGEDTITIKWAPHPLPEGSNVGYSVPELAVHKYELTVVGEGVEEPTLNFPSSTTTHTFASLAPSNTYRVRVRCLSRAGRWGIMSRPLIVRLADRPEVNAIAIGETFLSFTWSREVEEPQEAEIDYRITSTTSPFNQEQRLTIAKGDTNKRFTVNALTSSSTYKVQLRTLLDGVWGLWTDSQIFTTRRCMAPRFVERGEDFITITWPVLQKVRAQENIFDLIVTKVAEGGERTVVFQEEVQKASEEEGFRVEELETDTAYEIKGRARQVNRIEGTTSWGEYSMPIRVRTLKAVALQVLDIGEDYVQLHWSRALVRPADGTEGDGDDGWMDLKYEMVVGCIDTGNDNVLHREISENRYTVANLLPSTSYVISVRACDDLDQWGLWRRVRVQTLPAMRTSIHEIGESFARLMWRREDVVAEESGDEPLVVGDPVAAEYNVFVFSDDGDDEFKLAPNGYPKGGNSEISMSFKVPSHQTSFRIPDLLPDRTYAVVLRASTLSGKWGIWSRELRFHTVAPFRIPVNTLQLGENYVHLSWSRNDRPSVGSEVYIGDYSVTNQQLRIRGKDTQYAKDHTLPADQRELKVYGLSPATVYSVQLRACSSSGEWGQWSAPVSVLTRATITCRAEEVAEDYLTVVWEKPRAANEGNYPTGRGYVSTYQLRVSSRDGLHTETFVTDQECPYRVSGLNPNTYYCVEIKANYNDDEWGLWSTPLWCMTMRSLQVSTEVISEEYCTIKIIRPMQHKRLPEEDGNQNFVGDRVIAFGQHRPRVQLCVTTEKSVPAPHAPKSNTTPAGNSTDLSLPPDCAGDRLVYLAEVECPAEGVSHTIPNLRANAVYSVAARSKLDNGEWSMWSTPSLPFVTVSPVAVTFSEIGESFLSVEWSRDTPSQGKVRDPTTLCRGEGRIVKSRIKLRDESNQFTIISIDSPDTTMVIQDLKPACTYGVSVQPLGGNGDWGVWSKEARVRTVPAMSVTVENVTEDAVWLSWIRETDLETDLSADTALNVTTDVRAYDLCIVGSGYFKFSRMVEGTDCFLRGLQPDSLYEVRLRTCSKTGQVGLWSSRFFATLPTLRLSFANVGEQFAVVQWRRHLPASLNGPHLSGQQVVEAADFVEAYRMRIESVGSEPLVYELPPNIGSFRLQDLIPSTEFKVWICARGYEGVWGLWNEESRLCTLPKLALEIQDIGEDYVSVTWARSVWSGERSPASADVKVWEIEGAVSNYEVVVRNENGDIVGSATTPFSVRTAKIGHLGIRSVYTVSVRAKDSYGEWGLWSTNEKFATLQPVRLNVLRVGETFVQLEWARRNRLLKRRVAVPKVAEEAVEVNEVEASGDISVHSEGSDEEHVDAQYSDDEYATDVRLGAEDVRQWQIRLYGSTVFGGQPGATDDYKELTVDSATTSQVLGDLEPDTRYTVAIRAQNSKGEWGQWSVPAGIDTEPQLVASALEVGEDYFTIAWERPHRDIPEGATYSVSFPPPQAVHSYQISIQPVGAEGRFDGTDEPLTDGARVYDTTQPTLQLSSLLAGTRYRVLVREQMVSDGSSDLWDGYFGVYSRELIVETVEPMIVDPEEVGENHALLHWHRNCKSDDGHKAASRADAFELQVVRVGADGLTPFQGSMALRLSKHFVGKENKYVLPNLVPNAIYAVSVRAKTIGGRWGTWSKETKFITQKRLSMRVDLIGENSFSASWFRLGPDWICNRPSHPDDDVIHPQNSVEAAVARRDKQERDAQSFPAALRDVCIGDYSVKNFQLQVVGVTCQFEKTISLENGELSSVISDLSPNNVYYASVRSLASTGQWSLASPKVTICTLNPLRLSVGGFTESEVRVGWFRDPQTTAEHESMMAARQAEMRRDAENKEKQARFQKQQILQQKGDLGEEVRPEDVALSNLLIEERLAALQEVDHFLDPANALLGVGEVTAYQLHLFGESGSPFIMSHDHTLPLRKIRKKVVIKQGKTSKVVMRRTEVDEMEPGSNQHAVGLGTLLLDATLNPQTHNLRVGGLTPNARYYLSIRWRSVTDTWGEWTAPEEMTTLDTLSLRNGRFGEHYINLFWERPSEKTKWDYKRLQQTVDDFERQFKHLTPQALEAERIRDSQEYERTLAKIKEWKSHSSILKSYEAGVEVGGGEVTFSGGLPIQGYHIRVVHEDGTVQEQYVEEGQHRYTLSGLRHNAAYTVLACAHYSGGVWGVWTKPLKIMTQNLIQLQIQYVGENFVDIEWKRAPNKKIPNELVATAPVLQGRGYQYEVSIGYSDPATGEAMDERRAMRDCTRFRVDDLPVDTRCVLRVREWDPSGEWGLWGSEKSCVTMAGVGCNIEEVGEDWLELRWDRLPSNVALDYEDPTFVQFPSEEVEYYVRVEEITESKRVSSDRDGAPDGDLSTPSPNKLPEMDDITRFLTTQQQEDGACDEVLFPKPIPSEKAVAVPYSLVKRFDANTRSFKVADLTPNSFYTVEVMAVTTGSHPGVWSLTKSVLTLSKVAIRCDLVDEEVCRLSWLREKPRTLPNVDPITGDFNTVSYELEADGFGKHAAFCGRETFPASIFEYKMCDLMMNNHYCVRIRARDVRGRNSLWSESLNFVTLQPVRVAAGQITETSVSVEWGRGVQEAAFYPEAGPSVVFGHNRMSQNHIRVFTTDNRNTPYFEKQLGGTVSQFTLPQLRPNTAYVVQARCSNVVGEWSRWSEERTVYTLKPLTTSVVAVGEDYIALRWERDAPDELPDVIKVEMGDTDAESTQDQETLRALQMKKRYPLLDKPEVASAVYTTARTEVAKYAISVTRQNESDGWVTEVPSTNNIFKIPQLAHDSVYIVAVRACYGEDTWGPWSEAIKSGTLNLLKMEVRNVGEDYIASEWHRAPNGFPSQGVSTGRVEETVCFECSVHDFTNVPIGEEQHANMDSILVTGMLVENKGDIFKALKPNRRYRLAVRRWFKPSPGFAPTTSDIPAGRDNEDSPITEQERLRQTISVSNGLAGVWSDAVVVLTLKEMVVLVNDITEGGITVRWERDPEAATLSSRQCVKVPSTVLSYHLRVDEMTPDGSLLEQGPNSLHVDQQFGPDGLTFKLVDLRPDTVYRVDVRCCADRVWGLWSRPTFAVTLPKLQVDISSIGEDYVGLSWGRSIRRVVAPNGTDMITGNVANVVKYELEMGGMGHHYTTEKKFKASRTTFKVKHLEPAHVYNILMRSCDDEGVWSMWSDRVVFATLKPLKLSFGQIAEQFVYVNWGRDEQTQEEYKVHSDKVRLGDTSVLSYHFCVFAMEELPSAAVVDKQFRGNVSKFRVTNLQPSTSYIAIVRSCNNDEQWGLWSEERIVMTQKVLVTDITSIGENYVSVKWRRDDESNPVSDTPSSLVARQEATSYHLCLTSESETIDKHFSADECVYTADELRMPMYAVRSLRSDTKYILSLQACYGPDEWGMWSKPITFITLNNLAVKVSSITESSAEFTWGRAQQNALYASDPNVLVWRGTITRYQLLLRKVEEMRAQEMRDAERDMGAIRPGELKQPGPLPSDDEQSHTAVETDESGFAVVTTTRGEREVSDNSPPQFFFEQEMEVKLAKYVQTLSRIDKLEVNTEYHFQVRALDDNDEWGFWSEVFFDTPPCAPMNPILRKDGPMVQFTWESPDPTQRYTYCVEQAVLRDGKSSPARRGKPGKDPNQLDWRVVDTIEETHCRMRAFGPLNKIRCRVKCCKLNSPTSLFSRYSHVVAVGSTVGSTSGIHNLWVATVSKSAALVEWDAVDGDRRPATPTPPSKVSYRILLGARGQTPSFVASSRSPSYEFSDLTPDTAYAVQVVVETDSAVSSANPTLKFTTKAAVDRGVYKWAPGTDPLGELLPPEQAPDPSLNDTLNSHRQDRALPALRAGSARNPTKRVTASPLTPKPPSKPGSKLSTPVPRQSRGPSPLRPPGTAPHGATRPTKGSVSITAPPRTTRSSLPPVSGARQTTGATGQAVERFDYVGFEASDDEPN